MPGMADAHARLILYLLPFFDLMAPFLATWHHVAYFFPPHSFSPHPAIITAARPSSPLHTAIITPTPSIVTANRRCELNIPHLAIIVIFCTAAIFIAAAIVAAAAIVVADAVLAAAAIASPLHTAIIAHTPSIALFTPLPLTLTIVATN